MLPIILDDIVNCVYNYTNIPPKSGTQKIQKMGQGAMGLGILGRIQVKPRWENDSLWLHDGRIRESGQGRVWVPPPRGKSGGGQTRV